MKEKMYNIYEFNKNDECISYDFGTIKTLLSFDYNENSRYDIDGSSGCRIAYKLTKDQLINKLKELEK